MIGYVGNLLGTRKYAAGGTVAGDSSLTSIDSKNPYGLAVPNQSGASKVFNAIAGQTPISKTPLLQATNAGQLATANTAEQNALGMQNTLAQQLAAQGGMQNQANMYGQQQGLLGQQQGLASQLGEMAQGGGPNPALAQFQQATGQNVANQAALMAGQRGANANVGLMARQAAQQGAGIEQGAAGQLAAQQAQQQLNAVNALQNQQQAMGGTMGQMQNVAGQQISNQMQGAAQYGQMAGQNQQAQMGAAGQYNAAQMQQAQINAETAKANAAHKSSLLGNIAKGIGAVGGAIGGFYVGGPAGAVAGAKGGYNLGNKLSGGGGESSDATQAGLQGAVDSGGIQTAGGDALNSVMAAHGGLIPSLAAHGGHVGGRAQVDGDSYKNDTVPTMLSPGEIVIPRHVLQSEDPVGLAAQFVKHTMEKKGQQGFADGGEVPQQPEDNMGRSPETLAFGDKLRDTLKSGYQAITENPNPIDLLGQGAMNVGSQALQAGNKYVGEKEAAEEQASAPEQQKNIQNAALQFGTSPQQQTGNEVPQYKDPYAAAMGLESRGLDIAQHAQEGYDQKKAQIAQDQINFNQIHQQEYEKQRQELAIDTAAKTKAYADSKVDPNHYWNSLSTGEKIGNIAGILVSSLNTDHSNMAMDILQKNIDRDVAAQKENIGIKHSLVEDNFRKFGDLDMATKMAKVQQADIASAQLDKAAAEAGTPLAQSQAMQAKAALQLKYQPLIEQIAQKNAMIKSMGQMGGKADPAVAVRLSSASPEEKKMMYEEVSKNQELSSMRVGFERSANQLSQKMLNGTFSPNDANSARNYMAGAIQKLAENKLNVDQAEKLADSMLPQKTDLSPLTLAHKAGRREQFFHTYARSPVSDSYNIPLQNFESTSQKINPMQLLEPQDQAKAQWAANNIRNPQHAAEAYSILKASHLVK